MTKKTDSEFIREKIKFEKRINQENKQISKSVLKDYAEILDDPEISTENLKRVLMETEELRVKLNNWKLLKPNLGFIIDGQKQLALKNLEWYLAALDGIIRECNIRLKNREDRKQQYLRKTQNDLSAFEIALKHWYLEKAGVEQYFSGNEVAKKYVGIKNTKNIELSFNKITKREKQGNRKQLQKILNSLSEFPHVQKAIKNDLDKLE